MPVGIHVWWRGQTSPERGAECNWLGAAKQELELSCFLLAQARHPVPRLTCRCIVVASVFRMGRKRVSSQQDPAGSGG